MPQPASDPNEQEKAPGAKPLTPPAAQEFDLLAFWIMHRTLITRLVAGALIAIAIWGAYEFMEYRKRTKSEEALAAAKKPDDFRKLIADWGGTPSGGTAHLLLADELRKEGKADEAARILKEFTEKYPVHPLRAAGLHALAVSLEIAGKTDEALASYQRLAGSNAKSAFAPLALLGEARVLTVQNKPDDARKQLEALQQQFPGSPFSYEALMRLEQIKNSAGRKTGGTPRPAPPAEADPAKPPKPPTPPTPAPPTPPAPVPPKPAPSTPTLPQPAPPKPPQPSPAPPAPAPKKVSPAPPTVPPATPPRGTKPAPPAKP